jgi:hypothetical protein
MGAGLFRVRSEKKSVYAANEDGFEATRAAIPAAFEVNAFGFVEPVGPELVSPGASRPSTAGGKAKPPFSGARALRGRVVGLGGN